MPGVITESALTSVQLSLIPFTGSFVSRNALVFLGTGCILGPVIRWSLKNISFHSSFVVF